MTIDNVINLPERHSPEILGDEEWHAHLREAMKQVQDAFAARERGGGFVANVAVGRFAEER